MRSKGVCSKPTVWDGDYDSVKGYGLLCPVLSPPCGMVTGIPLDKEEKKELGSKPTVWDGDEKQTTAFGYHATSSKPTVWDGDNVGGEKLLSFMKAF